MSVSVKAGTGFSLPVEIEDENFDSISAIEFLFKQSLNGNTLKTAYWSAEGESLDAEKMEDEDVILVAFSRADTYLFRQNERFYMDTRIHYDGSEENPYTGIVTLMMDATLFEAGEEVSSQ